MCWLSGKIKQKTIEEIVADNSIGMNDCQKAEYWWELTQSIFALLGKVEVPLLQIPTLEWRSIVSVQYPQITNVEVGDKTYQTTTLDGLSEILKRDWTDLVPYVSQLKDCEDFAGRLTNHLIDFYNITAVVEVWGQTTGGYHGFNLAVVQLNDSFVARLIEPQSDLIFVEQGPLGKYVPDKIIRNYGRL